MLGLNNELVRNKDVILKSLNGKYWAFNTSTGAQYNISELSYFILEQLTEPDSIEHVVAKICEQYSVTEETALEDCKAFLSYCLKKAIIIKNKS